MLSPDGRRLDSPALLSHADLAIHLLGLGGRIFTGDDLATARTAVTMQVNRQIQKQLDPDVFLAASVSRGQRSISYADDASHVLDPTARQLVSTLLVAHGGAYGAPVHTRR